MREEAPGSRQFRNLQTGETIDVSVGRGPAMDGDLISDLFVANEAELSRVAVGWHCPLDRPRMISRRNPATGERVTLPTFEPDAPYPDVEDADLHQAHRHGAAELGWGRLYVLLEALGFDFDTLREATLRHPRYAPEDMLQTIIEVPVDAVERLALLTPTERARVVASLDEAEGPWETRLRVLCELATAARQSERRLFFLESD